MNIDWSEAPEGATHYAPDGNGFAGYWFKLCGAGWMIESVHDTWEFAAPSRERLSMMIERPVSKTADLIDRGYLEPLSLHHQWCGRIYRLPPIGSTVRIDKGDRIIWQDAEMFIGVDVTLVAAFKTGDTQMVAVEHPVEKQCCCFRADMVLTLEQIEAGHRKDTISKMLRYAAITGESFRDVCGKMYDAGLRFEVKP